SLKAEINRIAESSHFNGIKLLDGSLGITRGGTIGDTTTVGTTTFDFGKITEFKAGATFTITNEKADGSTGTHTVHFLEKGSTAITATASDSYVVLNGALATDRNAFAGALNTANATLGIATTGAAFADNVLTLTNLAVGERAQATATLTGMGLNLQIGDTASQRVSVSITNMNETSLGLKTVDVSTEAKASKSIDLIKAGINMVSGQRADLGAIQNRLEHTINNLTTTTENMTAAESRIRDTDMAKEMMAFTKNNVLAQAAQAMLAQANQQPQQVLQLLR
ncbi:MAG: flagellin, partial [Oscillospiraceae bacterium]